MVPKQNSMQKFLVFFSMSILIFSCSRKTIPATTSASTENKTTANPTNSTITPDSSLSPTTEKKIAVYNPPVKTATPKAITVNDKAATRTADGRYYYDLEGKRYWRNKKDGKYYLYYKGMFENKNFQ
jgi:hypothetical protein